MKVCLTFIGLMLINYLAYSQHAIYFKTGPDFTSFRSQDDPHTFLNYDARPGWNVSVEYVPGEGKPTPAIGVGYKTRNFDKDFKSGGIACAQCYEEHLKEEISMIEIYINEKIYLSKKIPLYFLVGLQFSKTVSSSAKGYKIIPDLVQLPDTNISFWRFNEIKVESKNDHQDEFGLITGFGYDWFLNDQFGIQMSGEISPVFDSDINFDARLNIGVIWMINKNADTDL